MKEMKSWCRQTGSLRYGLAVNTCLRDFPFDKHTHFHLFLSRTAPGTGALNATPPQLATIE
jgi:hypothetical protein